MNIFGKKTVDSVITRLTSIASELEAIVESEKADNRERDSEIAELEVQIRESSDEIARATRISERVNEFVA